VSLKFTKPLLITKLKATAVHLSLSAIVFVVLAYLMYFVWYPQPYFTSDGGWQGLRLIAAVDLVLGPLITFLIFDLRKSRREIVMDLTIILVIQLGSLVYGIHAAYTQRPIAIVMFNNDYVFSTTMEQYAGTLQSPDQLRQYSDETPPIIYSEIPLDKKLIDEVNRKRFVDNVVEHAQIQLYRPADEMVVALRERQSALLGRLQRTGSEPAFEEWLELNGKTRDSVLLERFLGRYKIVWLVFDAEGHYLDYFMEAEDAVAEE
jgi:hypothetical protein